MRIPSDPSSYFHLREGFQSCTMDFVRTRNKHGIKNIYLNTKTLIFEHISLNCPGLMSRKKSQAETNSTPSLEWKIFDNSKLTVQRNKMGNFWDRIGICSSHGSTVDRQLWSLRVLTSRLMMDRV